MSEFQDWNMFAFFVIICGSQAKCDQNQNRRGCLQHPQNSTGQRVLSQHSVSSVDKTLLLNGEPP